MVFTLLCIGGGYSFAQEHNAEVRLDSCASSVSASSSPEIAKPELTRHFYVKTNGIGWTMGITNVAVEIDFRKHWSATFPLYWSGWNYFKSTLKFRTLTLQPEIRYWILSEDNDGLFTGTHLGLGWYNYALDGNSRIQDHGGHCPAFGGGFSAGYRLPINHNKRLRLEFSLGIGVYGVYYDKFINHKNGLVYETKKRAWFGIDQATASIVYTFDWKKKGGAR